MSRAATPPGPRSATAFTTVADLLEALGGIPPERVRLQPPPGTATAKDVIAVLDRENIPCELIDGVLVEKTMGMFEAYLAGLVLTALNLHLRGQDLGFAAGADGVLRLTTGLIRIPDVSFISWDHVPGRKVPRKPIPKLPLDLAVEVLSKGNTKAEMARKLREYFDAGARLVWYIDPKRRTARVYTAPDRSVLLHEEDGVLDGGDVLPGFRLALRDLFARAERG